jgi:NadR type nicotinamide-nucleotide adenylyltransferase
MIKKIVAIGAESTGKSTLSKQLAAHYNTFWCPEYAREYLNQNGIKYTYDDLLKISQGQLIMEDYCVEKMSSEWSIMNSKNAQLPTHNPPLLFIDTNMYVMKVWYEYVFGKCEYMVLDAIAGRSYDLYLLCNIDLPWTDDPMREHPAETSRKELCNMYRDLLIHQSTPWVEISGNNDERLKTAIKAVEQYCLA